RSVLAVEKHCHPIKRSRAILAMGLLTPSFFVWLATLNYNFGSLFFISGMDKEQGIGTCNGIFFDQDRKDAILIANSRCMGCVAQGLIRVDIVTTFGSRKT
ncbi:MAG: hypothetical protein VX809_06790, partial [Pseudomonadota bacterium]|nr:hypothetical protein [Pseudomonadota bacterium]